MTCYDSAGKPVADGTPGCTATPPAGAGAGAGVDGTTPATPAAGCPDPRVPDPTDKVLAALPPVGCSPCWNNCQQEQREREDACNVLRQRVALYLQGRGCPSNVTAAPMINYCGMAYPPMGGGYSAPPTAQAPQAFSAPPRYRR